MLRSRLMILNQNESECRQMAEYFEESGYSVVCCIDEEETIDMLSRGKHGPDL